MWQIKGYESWIILQSLKKKIKALELKYKRKFMRIWWVEKNKNTNILPEMNTEEYIEDSHLV